MHFLYIKHNENWWIINVPFCHKNDPEKKMEVFSNILHKTGLTKTKMIQKYVKADF